VKGAIYECTTCTDDPRGFGRAFEIGDDGFYNKHPTNRDVMLLNISLLLTGNEALDWHMGAGGGTEKFQQLAENRYKGKPYIPALNPFTTSRMHDCGKRCP
jgi:hypothetical protein